METVKINMVPKGAVKAAHASQGDAPRVVRFELFDEFLPYTLDGSEDITLKVVRPDTEEIVSSVENTEEAYIDVSFTSEMTAIRGVANCEIKISKSGAEIGSHNFDLNIERDAYGEDITVETASGVIATFTTGVIDNLVGLKTTFEPKQDLHGYSRPWPAGAGKNKFPNSSTFPYNSTVLDTYYAEFSPNVNERKIPIIHLEPNVTYTLSMFVIASKTPFSISVGIGDGRYLADIITVSGLLGNTRCSATFTVTPEQLAQGDVLAFRAPRYSERGDFTCEVSDVMLEIGSSATDYEPYENICEIEGIDEINLSHTGVNLWGGEKMADAFVNSRTYSKDTSAKTFTFDVYPVSPYNETILKGCFKPNTQYTFILRYTAANDNNSLRILYSDGTRLAFNLSTANTKTDYILTSAIGKTIKEISLTYYSDGLVTVYYDESGLFEGVKTIDEFKAYTGESALVEIGQTVYGGYYDKDLGIVLTKKIKVYDGSETWYYSSTYNRVYINIPDTKINSAFISNEIKNDPTVSDYNGYINDQKNLIIYAPISITSSTDWQTWLGSNSLEICYELETPIIIPADAVNFETVKGVNNVWSDTNGETEVKFYVKEA